MDDVGRVNVLGVRVSAVDLDQALLILEGWIERREQRYVCVTGVHGVMESQSDPEVRRIHNAAGLVTPDGMPLVWLARLGGFRHVSRVYGPDLMLAFCGRSVAKGYKHFLYGGGEGVAERLALVLRTRFSGLDIVGHYTPPLRPPGEEESPTVIETINARRPDVVWVGLSTPKQELWMDRHRSKIEAPVLIGVGAAFDFCAGLKKQAPRWMQRSGLEWLFRLGTEPRRLWWRYLTNIPRFLFGIGLQLAGLRGHE